MATAVPLRFPIANIECARPRLQGDVSERPFIPALWQHASRAGNHPEARSLRERSAKITSVVLDGELAVPCTRNPLQRG